MQKRIAILYEASQAVLSTFDLDEVLNHILAIVRDHFHLENGAIFLLDRKQQNLVVRARFGRDEAQGITATLPLSQGLIGAAFNAKAAILAADVSKDPRYVAQVPSTRSELAVPLMVRGEPVGVLDCQSSRIEFFDPETIELLTLFSAQASIALENARLYSLEQRRSAQLEAINAIARQTTGVVDLEVLLEKLCKLVAEWFKVDHVAVLLMENGALTLRAHSGRLTPTIEKGAGISPESGVCSRALSAGEVIIENDVWRSSDYLKGFAETRSEMCIPLIFFDEKLGVLTLESSRPDAFDPADVGTLRAVGDMSAGAIQNTYYFERARTLAYVDGLTGVYNRRYFETRIQEEMERVRRFAGNLCVIMIDIDFFKKLNDEFGHLLGDEVLRQVPALFIQQLRKIDVVCRYGGEEFAILLTGGSADQTANIAEKLRRVVESYHFPGVPRPVTISAGVAEFLTHGANRDELVAAADNALYAAKQQGRNRVISAAAHVRETNA